MIIWLFFLIKGTPYKLSRVEVAQNMDASCQQLTEKINTASALVIL